MKKHEYPDIGHWYQDGLRMTMFKVVALDQEGGIEVQYFDGEIEELDLDTWYDLALEEISAPKDWSGPFELVEEDFELFDGGPSEEGEFSLFDDFEEEEGCLTFTLFKN